MGCNGFYGALLEKRYLKGKMMSRKKMNGGPDPETLKN